MNKQLLNMRFFPHLSVQTPGKFLFLTRFPFRFFHPMLPVLQAMWFDEQDFR
jgi:hypothetical protein